MEKLKLYISGKITGIKPYSIAEKRFNETESMLQNEYEVVNPVKLNPITEEEYEKMTDEEKEAFYWKCMDVDLEALKDCQVIYMLSGYETSKGAMMELNKAKELGLKIIFET